MSEATAPEDVFGVAAGDDVLVRVREGGQVVAKYVAEVMDVTEPRFPGKSPQIRLMLPWGRLEQTVLKPHEAEFEAVEDRSEVEF